MKRLIFRVAVALPIVILMGLETAAVAQTNGQTTPDSFSPPKSSTTLTKATLMDATPMDATKCTGDSVRANPPIPNYPTHIRNVVWRNMRAMCTHTTALQVSGAPTSTTPANLNSPSQSVVH